MSYGYGPPAGVPEVTVDELDEARQRGAPIVDVREPDEFESGHIAGAALIPMGQVVERVDEIPRNGPVYVVCASGQRSGRASQWYRAQGIDARNLAGGMKAWITSGRPVERGIDPEP